MNPLDRRIAELKGWKPTAEQMKRTIERGETISAFMPLDGYNWSTSDAKAFELVDELQGKFAFYLSCSPSGIAWYATLSPVVTGIAALNPPELPQFHGDGITRPEAICRAYIAAREWMATKAGA